MKRVVSKTVTFIILFTIIIIFIGSRLLNYTNITITDNNRSINLYTDKKIIADIIKEAGIKLSDNDLICPSLDAHITKEKKIEVCRVKHIYDSRIKPIKQRPVIVDSKALPKGDKLVINPGASGYMEEIFKYTYMNGQKVSEKVVDVKIICKPRIKVVLKGISNKYNKVKLSKIVDLKATAYSPGSESCGIFADGFTSLGLRADYGIVAIDPGHIPLGTLMYVEGYGYAIAGDIGGAIKKDRIDLCFANATIAREFGRKNIRSYILE